VTPAITLPADVGSATAPDVALTPGGDTIAVWVDALGVRVAVRPPGGTFGVAARLAAAGAVPRVTVAPDGRALVTWVANNVVMGAFRAAGGGFGTAQTLSRSSTRLGAPQAVFAADGRAIVAWERDSGIDALVAPAGGTFAGTGKVIGAAAADVSTPRVAVDATGNAAAIWAVYDGTTTHLKMAASPAGKTGFPGTIELASQVAAIYDAPTLVIDGAGTATAVWRRSTLVALENGGFGTTDAIEAISVAVDGTTGPVQDLDIGESPCDAAAAQGTCLSAPSLAIDGAGNATAVWTSNDRDGATVTIRRVTRPRGQPRFGFTTDDAMGTGADAPQAGTATVTPRGSDSVALGFVQSAIVRSAVARNGGAFEPAAAISPAGAISQQLARFAGAADGDGVATWANTNGTVQMAAYDATPPELRDVQAPDPEVGKAVTFSVSPFDAWTSVGVGWNFGDGAPDAIGPTVTHVFARRGTYTVTVGAADTLGNVTSTTRTVKVTSTDVTPPTLSALALTHGRFSVSTKATAVAAALPRPRGTTIRFAVSEQATVRLYVRRILGGRTGPKGCSTTAKTGKACTVYRGEGKLTRSRKAGRASLPFSGRMGKRALKPGRYRLTVIAVDSVGNASEPRRIRFTIVER
jgi:hypothetical protein